LNPEESAATLEPPEEMDAVRAMVKADEKGEIEIYASRWS
jgi:hypothetical protein